MADKIENNEQTTQIPAEEKPKSAKKEPKEPKIKKITEKDFKRTEALLKSELSKRKTSQFRQKHEAIWRVVDRQVSLDPIDVVSNVGEEWLNSFELGVLAQASEIMTADLLRVVFPDARAWFEAHVEMPTDIDVNTGDKKPNDKKMQAQLDGRLRAMMTQQHVTFGLRDRVELSIKEALHHGAFVAEVNEEFMDLYLQGTSVKEISAPSWKPHSMWNCYPDPSPSLIGSNMYYTGSMFIEQFMPRHKFMEMATGEGWIKGAIKKIPKEEHTVKDNQTKDLKLTYYWGDVVIPKSGDGMEATAEDLFFPNHKAILANGKLVYLDANTTPYPPIIYKGYEKMDVRDPYFMSPIIKQSPMQKITSILANEFVNSVQLNARPPIVYDGNDPDFVVNGGPVISPGSKTSSKGTANFKEMKIGDPRVALEGVQFGVQSMKEALGRPGITAGDRATAAEIQTKQADSEAGPFGFAIKVDDALRTFLYMQHAMNLSKKNFKFSYYSPELDSPDFLRVEHKDLPETVHFEVVGSKGMLGEARRHQAFAVSTQFLSSNPLTASLLEPMEIAKQMYQDAGVKSPERFLKQADGIPPEIKQKMEQAAQVIQQLKAELEKEQSLTAVKTAKMNLDHEAKMAKVQSQHISNEADQKAKMIELESKYRQAQSEHEANLQKIDADKHVAAAQMETKLKTSDAELEHKSKILNDAQQLVTDKALAHIEKTIREFEHKIELLIALEKKEQEIGLSKGEEAKEGKLTENLLAMHQEVMKSLQDVTKTITAPKKVKRDENGRMVGVEMDIPADTAQPVLE